MNERRPWTQQQLDEMLPKIEKELDNLENEFEKEIKPVGPLTETEAIDYLMRLMDIAAVRPLTPEECFLHGQLLNVFKQAVQAETLGYKKAGGRYFVMSEGDINNIMSGKK